MAAFVIHFIIYFDNIFYNFLKKILYFYLTKYILKCIMYLEVKGRIVRKMLDMNNVEIKTGDVVEISGAYFKNDNGLYFVEHSAGDPGWSGSDHCMRKISKTGKLSTAKRNICFWPISIATNSWMKRIEAKQWNDEHARIQVRGDIDRSKVAEHFLEKAKDMIPEIERLSWNFGDDCQCVKDQKEIKVFLESIAKEIQSKSE